MNKKSQRLLLAGLPAFIVAFGLNYLLVKQFGMAKSLAYALVLVVQIVINFFVCRHWVFPVRPEDDSRHSFLIFFNGIALFRLADWGVYSLLTHYGRFPILAAQLFNVALFAFLKYEFARQVFERKKNHPNLPPVSAAPPGDKAPTVPGPGSIC